MKLAVCITITFFLCLAIGTPIVTDKLNVKHNFLQENMVIHTAEHEIISIAVTLGVSRFGEVNKTLSGTTTLFFAVADNGPNGEKIYKGLYVLKNREATKLLENGRDTSVESITSNVVYFGASDGIYKYNAVDNEAVKYGNITDSVVQLAKVNGSDIIYILAEDRQIYNVTEGGTKITRVDGVADPREMALDNSNNLYYVGADNKPYVLTADGVREITGFASNVSYTKLVRPPYFFESGLPFVSEDDAYIVFPNSTRVPTNYVMKPKPSAYAVDAAIVQFYGYNKKIYEYNFVTLIFEGILNKLKSSLQNFQANSQN